MFEYELCASTQKEVDVLLIQVRPRLPPQHHEPELSGVHPKTDWSVAMWPSKKRESEDGGSSLVSLAETHASRRQRNLLGY